MNNQLIIIGNVGQAPRSVSFANTGNKVVKFSVAVKEFSNNEESTMWIDVDAWNGLGENVLATVTKGREVVLNGRLSINDFTKEVDGEKVKVYKPVLKLMSFHLCGPKPTAAAKDSSSSSETSADAASTDNNDDESSPEGKSASSRRTRKSA